MAFSSHCHSLMLVYTFSFILLAFNICAADSGSSPSESQTATKSTRCTINCFRADPVCGVNGVTYSCGCAEAACNNVTVAYRGACQTSTCTINCFRYDPVCGVNGVTYGCGTPEAECNNVAIAYSGPCQNVVCPRAKSSP